MIRLTFSSTPCPEIESAPHRPMRSELWHSGWPREDPMATTVLLARREQREAESRVHRRRLITPQADFSVSSASCGCDISGAGDTYLMTGYSYVLNRSMFPELA